MTNPSPKPRLRNRAKALVCYRQTNNVPGGGAMSTDLFLPGILDARSCLTSMSTISTERKPTIEFGTCDCFQRDNTLQSTGKRLSRSEKKCSVCGKNCGRPVALDLFCGAGGAAYGLRCGNTRCQDNG